MEEAFIGAVRVPAIECRCGTPLGGYAGAIDMYESDLANGYKVPPAEFAEKIELYKLRADFLRDNLNNQEALTSEIAFEDYAKNHFLPYKRYLATNKKTPLPFVDFYEEYLKTRTLYSRELSSCCIGSLLNPQIMAPNTYIHTVRRKELEQQVRDGKLTKVTKSATTVEELSNLVRQSVDTHYSDFYAIDSSMVFSVDLRPVTKDSRVFTIYPRLDGKPYESNFLL